jgi:hypothetical protein
VSLPTVSGPGNAAAHQLSQAGGLHHPVHDGMRLHVRRRFWKGLLACWVGGAIGQVRA